MRAKLWLSLLSGVVLGVLLLSSNASAQTAEKSEVIRNGSRVSLEYTLRDKDGHEIESNKGKKPLTYVHGQNQIIRGLEKGLEGMSVGEEKTVEVKPEDAYGPVNPRAFREVPRDSLPPEALKVGTSLLARNGQGQSFPVRVHEIKEKTVVIDFNHPLAGKTLIFQVKILTIQAGEKK